MNSVKYSTQSQKRNTVFASNIFLQNMLDINKKNFTNESFYVCVVFNEMQRLEKILLYALVNVFNTTKQNSRSLPGRVLKRDFQYGGYFRPCTSR